MITLARQLDHRQLSRGVHQQREDLGAHAVVHIKESKGHQKCNDTAYEEMVGPFCEVKMLEIVTKITASDAADYYGSQRGLAQHSTGLLSEFTKVKNYSPLANLDPITLRTTYHTRSVSPRSPLITFAEGGEELYAACNMTGTVNVRAGVQPRSTYATIVTRSYSHGTHACKHDANRLDTENES